MYYEQIKAEVVKCCPEIMELKFGCEVRWKDEYKDNSFTEYEGTILWKTGRPERSVMILIKGKLNSERFMWVDDIEILGSPIELHHILRTINKKLRSGGFITLTSNGWLYYGTKKILYNLALPIASQSEETLKFLSELLTGNK